MERLTERVVHEVRRSVEYTDDGVRCRITARAKLYALGNQAPYFSATADVDVRRGSRWCEDAGGCLHAEILRHFPTLAPVVRVHLADEGGRPMHAVANALYWCGLTSYTPDDDYGRRVLETDEVDGRTFAPFTLAEHLRVSVDEARHIRREIALVRLHTWNPVIGTVRDLAPEMGEILAAHDLPARWQRDADAAVAVLTSHAACADHFVGAETLRCVSCGWNAATQSFDGAH